MADHEGDLRGSDGDGDMHPTRAWVERAGGEEVPLVLERTDEHSWIARPPDGVAVRVAWGDHLRIDRLGPGDRVEFEDVIGPGHEDWSGRAATHPGT